MHAMATEGGNTLASHVCGELITKNTTLDGDLTCASGPALIIAANNVVLDLGGHTVSGDPAAPGKGPGILLRGVTGATVRNGTVQNFAAGVAINGGGRNLVQNLTVQDNRGALGGDFGDGIVATNSIENRIEGNTVLRNGPFSGISLVQACRRNVIRHNIVMDNNMLQGGGKPNAGRQDMGIRIEGPDATFNRVASNTVTGSGAHGIVVLASCVNPTSSPPCAGSPPNVGNEIINNTSHRNGTSGNGDGIKLMCMGPVVPSNHSTVTDNFANNNATNGISIDAAGANGSTNNTAMRNSAHGNGVFDGNDGNVGPPCDANLWDANDFGTVNIPCVNGHKPAATPATMVTAQQAPAQPMLPAWSQRGRTRL